MTAALDRPEGAKLDGAGRLGRTQRGLSMAVVYVLLGTSGTCLPVGMFPLVEVRPVEQGDSDLSWLQDRDVEQREATLEQR